MNKVIVIGCPGSGKTTFAEKLAKKTGLPLYYLDAIWHKSDRTHISREEFDKLHREALAGEKWIVDGNFDRTMAERIRYCDTVIYLDFSRVACLLGVVKRILTTYGKVRPDMGEGCPERFDMEFLQWVWNYNKNNRERNYQLLKEAAHAEKIVLKNRRAVQQFLKNL